jgi:hypothetical protein
MANLRKTVTPVFEIAALALVLLDIGLGFSAAWFGRRLDAEKELLASTVRQVAEEKSRVSRLEKFQAVLPGAATQVKQFTSDHIPPRQEVYLKAAHLVRLLADKSDVHLTGVGPKLEPTHDDVFFQRLGLEVTADGAFENLVRFGYGLETGSDFMVLRNFTFTSGEHGKLSLHVLADLYMTP